MTTPLGRFMNRVDHRGEGCWRWTGAISDTGYGSAWLGKQRGSAHRLMFELYYGQREPDVPQVSATTTRSGRGAGLPAPEHNVPQGPRGGRRQSEAVLAGVRILRRLPPRAEP